MRKGGGGQVRCERRIEVFVIIHKKNILERGCECFCENSNKKKSRG